MFVWFSDIKNTEACVQPTQYKPGICIFVEEDVVYGTISVKFMMRINHNTKGLRAETLYLFSLEI